MSTVSRRVTGVIDHRLAEDIIILSIDGFRVVNAVVAGKAIQCSQGAIIRDLVTHGTTDTIHAGIVQGVIGVQDAIGSEQGYIATLYFGYFVVCHRRMTLRASVIYCCRQLRISL